jgi:ubiquinone/menaquinone biosynthesis C-methylase UbiE
MSTADMGTADVGTADVVSHYEERYDEGVRLDRDPVNKLEWIRTRLVMDRYLPEPPAAILDVGGGPGVYAVALAEAGYDVELIDIVPRHIRQATERGVRAQIGDARDLPVPTNSQDAVLMLGPLYHLLEIEHRIAALSEAIRVGKKGAPVLTAAISRYAPAIDALDSGYWDDREFANMVVASLKTGRHINTTGNPAHFTTAYFHRPEELEAELLQAGLTNVEMIAVEGIGWAAGDLAERIEDEARLTDLLDLLNRLEGEPSILGASPHILGVGFVP